MLPCQAREERRPAQGSEALLAAEGLGLLGGPRRLAQSASAPEGLAAAHRLHLSSCGAAAEASLMAEQRKVSLLCPGMKD